MGRSVDPVLRVASIAVAVVAVAVLLGAMARHPYSYYQIMRWLTTGAAVLLVWRGAIQEIKWAWALVPLAVLFNPVAPIHFSHDTWQVLDLAVGMLLAAALVWLELALRPEKQ